MSRIDPNFPHDIFRFLHRPLRLLDAEQGDNFLERYLLGPQTIFEDGFDRIEKLKEIIDPAKTRNDLLQYLKDHVGFTKELNNITQDLSDSDLRKLISLAVALWKQKGTEPGYQNIVRVFTGKAVRVFNWFDFRLIVGEKAFGEEQLGEDAWLISVPGVEASQDQSNNVVNLLTFEGNLKDRSLTRNHAVGNGQVNFFLTPSSGFPQGSVKYMGLKGGVLTQSNSVKYDLSGDVTIEYFIRTNMLQASRTIFYKKDLSGKGIQIDIDTVTNTISFDLNDGTTSVSGSLIPSADLDDNQPRHLALIIDRTNGIRLYLDGVESTPTIPLGVLGDLTNSGQIVHGGSGVITNNFEGDFDNFRLSLNAVYDVSFSTLVPPLSGFIEYQEEELQEFQTDVRIVDEGDLNKILMLRILNLMRPASERINAIFIRFFDDFSAGSGRFNTLVGSSSVNINTQLEIAPGSIVATDVLNDTEFKNIVLQIKANDVIPTGDVFSILLFFQDVNNYYEYRIDTLNREVSFHKVVGGISTQIAAPAIVDIVPTTSYIFSVQTSYDPLNDNTLFQVYLDSNRIHSVVDGAFEKGKFGFKTPGSTPMQVNEIEMIQLPVDVRRVAPGFDL